MGFLCFFKKGTKTCFLEKKTEKPGLKKCRWILKKRAFLNPD